MYVVISFKKLVQTFTSLNHKALINPISPEFFYKRPHW